MTTLVTGFEPFGGSRVNSSELVVTALADRGKHGLITAILPTSYHRARERVHDLLQAHRPRTVLLLGLDESVAGIRLEQVARNFDDSVSPDNDGEIHVRERIIDGAPVDYRSSLPLKPMADAARALGEDVAFSHDAGGYVCNHVFFTAAHLVTTQLPGTRCGFVHLSFVEGPSERLTRLVEVVWVWVAAWQ